ncbi:MAG: hypothetical protein R3311_20605, partial [Oceanisphaera sp.]|nr:hypothetical protein [Oceanisphaera sp.]
GCHPPAFSHKNAPTDCFFSLFCHQNSNNPGSAPAPAIFFAMQLSDINEKTPDHPPILHL